MILGYMNTLCDVIIRLASLLLCRWMVTTGMQMSALGKSPMVCYPTVLWCLELSLCSNCTIISNRCAFECAYDAIHKMYTSLCSTVSLVLYSFDIYACVVHVIHAVHKQLLHNTICLSEMHSLCVLHCL